MTLMELNGIFADMLQLVTSWLHTNPADMLQTSD